MKNKPNTIHELKNILRETDILESYYNVPCDGKFYTDTVAYLKPKDGKVFEIGVFERGNFYDVREISTEEAACYAFIDKFYSNLLSNYDANGRQYKQISNHYNGNPKKHPFGKHGKHAHDYKYVDGVLLRGKARELTEDERKKAGDFLEQRTSEK